MALKNVVDVNLYDDSEREKFYKDVFLEALRGNISVREKYIYMETQTTTYRVTGYDFSLIFKPTFEYVYKNNLTNLIKGRKMKPSTVHLLYCWTHPIFDELFVKLEAKDKFLNDFRNKLQNDENYYTCVREATMEQINTLDLEGRRKYIDRFISLGVLQETDKISLGYFLELDAKKVKEFIEKNNLSEEDKIELVARSFVYEREKEDSRKKRHKQNHNNKVVGIANLLDAEVIIGMFLGKDLTSDEFARTKVRKEDLLAAPYEALICLLGRKEELPENLRIESKDIINAYGRSLNGDTILKLLDYGYIESQDFIEIYEINKALKHIDDESSLLEDESIKAYYTSSVLLKMKEDGKISPEFVQKYLEMQDFENNEFEFNAKSKSLVITILNQKDVEQATNDILYFFHIGLCDLDTAKESISPEMIESKFINNEMTMEEVFEFYQKGLLGDEAISKYFEPEEIIALYEKGKINRKCLRTIQNPDSIIQGFYDGKIEVGDLIELYLKSDNLAASDVSDALELSEIEVNISSFIDETIPFVKIKELFQNYLIDYASILELQAEGVINDEQFHELKTAIDTRNFFQELEEGRTYKVITSREGITPKQGSRNRMKEKEKENFSDEITLISKILGKDVESSNYSLIESYNVNGKTTSLNNYRIFGNEELDGIVILQKSKKENAVFVMNALQMMYFLKGKQNEDGKIEIKNKMKDKAYLKTIVGVETVEHSEYFAKNLVEATARISPKIAERVKAEDGQYIDEIGEMIHNMIEKYRNSKEKGRDDD